MDYLAVVFINSTVQSIVPSWESGGEQNKLRDWHVSMQVCRYVSTYVCLHAFMWEWKSMFATHVVHMYPCLTKRYLDMIRIHQSMHDVLQPKKKKKQDPHSSIHAWCASTEQNKSSSSESKHSPPVPDFQEMRPYWWLTTYHEPLLIP